MNHRSDAFFRFLNLCWALAVAMLVLALPVAAMPASPNPVKVVQPDGSVVTLRAHGDERLHWLEDQKGFPVVKDKASHHYVYAKLDEHGDLVPTALVTGKADPAAAGLSSKVMSGPAQIKKQKTPLPGPVVSRPRLAGAQSSGARFSGPALPVPPQGAVKNLVILCKFSDHTFGVHTRPQADYDVLFNAVGGDPSIAPTGSVRDYYAESSYGTMNLQSTVVAWVTLPNPEAYYADGKDGIRGTYPKNAQGMVKDALDLADALVDFSQFDQDNDGFVDSIDIIHSGYASETGGGGGQWIWSHRWSLWALPGGNWTSQDSNANGTKVKVYDYHTEAALWDTSGTGITRVGVICHETGHFFGLPDLYDTDYSSRGIGCWCLMANSWGFDGSQLYPPHLSAWCKEQLGWVRPTVVASGTLTAPRVETSPTIFKVTEGFPAGEYLLIENRQPYGFDGLVPQGGLAIWHIDENKTDNDDEGYPGQIGWPGNNKHFEVALLQADGLYHLEKRVNNGDAGDLYHAGGVSSITQDTVPNTNRYQGGIIAATGNTITNISASGPTMTFVLNGNPGVPVITSPVSASGVPGTPFSYQITATRSPTRYGATGLPDGLTVDPDTGLISGTPAGTSTSTVILSATNAVGSGTTSLLLTIAPVLTLAEALDAPAFSWSTGGSAPWTTQTATTHDGVDAAQSGAIGANQESDLDTTVTGPGTLTFWWKVSSEASYDYLRFRLDDAEVATAPGISGTLGWQQVTVSIPAGSHALRWLYVKDESVSAGADAGWVDQVVFTPGSQAPVITSAGTAFGTFGQAFSYQITATNTPTSYSAVGLESVAGLTFNATTGLISGTPAASGTYTVTLGATNAAGTGTRNLTLTVTREALTLGTALEAPALTWITGGNADWQPQVVTTHDGEDAARSGTVGNSQESYLETTVVGPGTLIFWWKVSSEPAYDFLRFYLDGAEQAAAPAISGAVDWQQKTISVPSGTHTLRWRYAKDLSMSSGSDTGWVDQVVYHAGGQPPVITNGVSATGSVSQPFACQITAANQPASYGATGLPGGLTVDPATGLISGIPTAAGTYSATLTVANDYGSGSATLAITIVPAGLTLPLVLDTTNLVWTTGGNGDWTPQTAIAHDGIDAARSGIIGHGQETYLETMVIGPRNLTFWWKVSSEGNGDYLRFLLDGAEVAAAPKISGTVDWQLRAVAIPAGSHTLRWVYSKDAANTTGNDAGWVDQVVLSSIGVPPANDNFADRLTLAVPVLMATGSNLYATRETGEPNPAGVIGRSSVWWSWTATATGSTTISTSGSNFDTILGVYTGSAVSALTEIASDDDPPRSSLRTSVVTFTATAGTQYQIAVDGYGGATGSIRLAITPPPVAPVFVTQPASQAVEATRTATFTAQAFGSPDPTYQWQSKSSGSSSWNPISGATASSYTTPATALSDNGKQFRCIAANGVGTPATSTAAILAVSKITQEIDFEPLPVKAFGDADFAVGATVSSGLPLTISSSNTAVASIVNGKLHIIGVGTSTITATQAGNANYLAATARQALIVAKGSQTITFPELSGKVFGEADFAPGATASSGLAVTYASSNPAVATIASGKIHLTGGGTTTITATQAGDAKWNAAVPQSQPLVVDASRPAILWGDKSIVYGTALSGTQLNATANVAGTFTYTLAGSPAAGQKPGAGTYPLMASFRPASPVPYGAGPFEKTVNLTVAKAKATVTLTNLSQACNGQPCPAGATTSPAGLMVRFSYNGSPVPPVAPGSYAVVGTVDDRNYQGSASGTLVIKIVAPAVTGAAQVSQSGNQVTLDVTCAAGVTHFGIEETSALSPVRPAADSGIWKSATMLVADGGKTVFRTTFDLQRTAGSHPLVFWARNSGTGAISATPYKKSFALAGPVISKFSPATVSAGEVVVITGTGFGAVPGSVRFGGMAGTVTQWSDTGIRCLIPADLGPVASTPVTVTGAAEIASAPKTLALAKFYLGAWLGSDDDGEDFIARITASNTAGKFSLRLNNRVFSCTIASTSPAGDEIRFAGTAPAISSSTYGVTLPAATCTGTISIASTPWLQVATNDGKVYEGRRPLDLRPDYSGYFLMYNPVAASHGNLYRLASNGVVKPVDVVTNQAIGYYADTADLVLLAGPSSSLPAEIKLHANRLQGDAVQTVAGVETAGAGSSSPLAGKRLATDTGLANASTAWICAELADPAIFRITTTISGNAITIKGVDAYDGRAGGVAFSMTGKIFREYDSTRCAFKVVGSSSTVREARGFIDGDRIDFTIKSKSPPGAPAAGQWLENEATGTKAP